MFEFQKIDSYLFERLNSKNAKKSEVFNFVLCEKNDILFAIIKREDNRKIGKIEKKGLSFLCQ